MKVTNDNLLDIITEASYRLHTEMKRAFKSNDLETYLAKIGMIDLYPSQEEELLYDTDPEGKILIIGEGMIKENVVYGCLKEFDIPKERVELYLDYEVGKTFEFKKIRYNPNYRLILFGSVPHSGKGKQDKSSIISQVENDDGYPKVVRLTDGHGLKFTRSSLKKAVEKEIMTGYLVV